jgi:RNA polymerase sigma-B factor
VRMPPSLHAELVEAARREGVSLNTFITGVLAGAIAWRSPEGPPRPPGWTRATLTVNLVAVVVLALIAIALLIVALVQA